MRFEGYNQHDEHDGEGSSRALDSALSELCDIALGRLDTPEYRDGGGHASVEEYTRDIFQDLRMQHGDEPVYEMAEELAETLEAEASVSETARVVRDAALGFLDENGRFMDE